MNRILFAAGGTAGHIEPAWAVSQIWQQRFPGDELAFLGTKSGLEVDLIPNRGGKLFLIPKVVAPRKFGIGLITFPFRMLHSIYKTLTIVRNFDLVVGFGGYVSASAYLAAFVLRKPIVIHEQNAKVGLANSLGARFAKSIAVAYPSTAKELKGAKVVGNPLREAIVSAALNAESDWQRARQSAKAHLQVSGPLVLVIGGSSGSKAINEVISDGNFESCTVIHAVGKTNELPKGNDKYHPVAYIEDMATALLAADLVISRSGAIAVTEFAALGKYALFIPLPIGNGEQELNAKELVTAHKAELISQREFTTAWLEANLQRLLNQGSPSAYGTILNSAEQIAECIKEVLI